MEGGLSFASLLCTYLPSAAAANPGAPARKLRGGHETTVKSLELRDRSLLYSIPVLGLCQGSLSRHSSCRGKQQPNPNLGAVIVRAILRHTFNQEPRG